MVDADWCRWSWLLWIYRPLHAACKHLSSTTALYLYEAHKQASLNWSPLWVIHSQANIRHCNPPSSVISWLQWTPHGKKANRCDSPSISMTPTHTIPFAKHAQRCGQKQDHTRLSTRSKQRNKRPVNLMFYFLCSARCFWWAPIHFNHKIADKPIFLANLPSQNQIKPALRTFVV